MSLVLLLETGDIPDSDGQIHGSGDNEILSRVELSRPATERSAAFAAKHSIRHPYLLT